MHIQVIIAGFAVGFAVGLTAVGGGPLLTPVLILFFKMRPAVAIGTAVAWQGLTKSFGGISHYIEGTVNRQVARFLCLGGIPGTVIGSVLTVLLGRYSKHSDNILARALAIMLVVAAVLLYYQAIAGKEWDPSRTEGQWMGPRRQPFTVLLGFMGGLLMALTSSGSGSMVVVLLASLYPLKSSDVVGTVVSYGAVVTLLAGLLHGTFGQIDFAVLGGLLIGGFPGIYLGTRLCARMPEKALRPVLATVLVATAVRMA